MPYPKYIFQCKKCGMIIYTFVKPESDLCSNCKDKE